MNIYIYIYLLCIYILYILDIYIYSLHLYIYIYINILYIYISTWNSFPCPLFWLEKSHGVRRVDFQTGHFGHFASRYRYLDGRNPKQPPGMYIKP